MDVEDLERAAAQAREEAAQIEADLLQTRRAEQLKWFKLFEDDSAGVVTVLDLQRGMMAHRGVNLDEETAKQVMEKHDTNNDGVLQPEEFDIDRLCSTVESLWAETAAREAEIKARERARAEEELVKQLELANLPPANEDTGLVVRLGSMLAYLLPLVDSLELGAPLMPFFPIVAETLAPLYVVRKLFNLVPFEQLLIFLGLSSLSESPSLPKLLRFNLRQAVEMDLSLAILGLLRVATFYLFFGTSQENLTQQLTMGDADSSMQTAILVNILIGILVFVAVVASVGYSVVATALGVVPDGVPFVSAWAQKLMKPTRPKDSEVQGPQLSPKSQSSRTHRVEKEK